MSWPYPVWGIHTDNGNEFLNEKLIGYSKANDMKFTRSRPYRKNDNPHAEQKNFQHVRCLVGYERFDTEEQVTWLNSLYDLYDISFSPQESQLLKSGTAAMSVNTMTPPRPHCKEPSLLVLL
jgi:hypothetical protein